MYHYNHAVINTPRVVIILGGETTYTCRVTGTIQQIQWLVNGTQLEDLNKRDGIEDDVTFGIGHLTFRNISEEYNNTNIQCIVTLTSGEIIRSNSATLLVQGEEKIICDTPIYNRDPVIIIHINIYAM